jgi:hypothetical protein
VIGVIVPVKCPKSTKVTPVTNSVPLPGSTPSVGSIPVTVKALTPERIGEKEVEDGSANNLL